MPLLTLTAASLCHMWRVNISVSLLDRFPKVRRIILRPQTVSHVIHDDSLKMRIQQSHSVSAVLTTLITNISAVLCKGECLSLSEMRKVSSSLPGHDLTRLEAMDAELLGLRHPGIEKTSQHEPTDGVHLLLGDFTIISLRLYKHMMKVSEVFYRQDPPPTPSALTLK